MIQERDVASGRVDAIQDTNKGRLAEQIAAELRGVILRGELVPGQHIRQEHWAKIYGVTRMPVREALKILTAQRMLTHDLHRGYFVTDMGASEVQQIYRLRIFVEYETLSSIRTPGPEIAAALEETLDVMDAHIAEARYSEALATEREFVFGLFDLSAQGRIAAEAKRLWDISEPYRSNLNVAATTADPTLGELRKSRREMLEAARAGEAVFLAEMVRTQRQSALDFFTSSI